MTELEQELERLKLADDWARYTAERLIKSLTKLGIGQTQALFYSIFYLSIPTDLSSIKHTFNFYGKFIDMGVGRGQKIESVQGNADMIALMGGGRRPKKWFSKTYYGQVAELRDLLMKKYGEQGADTIVESITNQVLKIAA